MDEEGRRVLDKLRSKYWRRQTSAFQNERVIPIITGRNVWRCHVYSERRQFLMYATPRRVVQFRNGHVPVSRSLLSTKGSDSADDSFIYGIATEAAAKYQSSPTHSLSLSLSLSLSIDARDLPLQANKNISDPSSDKRERTFVLEKYEKFYQFNSYKIYYVIYTNSVTFNNFNSVKVGSIKIYYDKCKIYHVRSWH